MSKLGNALPPIIMAVAMVVAFGVMIFLTVLYSPDCRSPHPPGTGRRRRGCKSRGAVNAPLNEPYLPAEGE